MRIYNNFNPELERQQQTGDEYRYGAIAKDLAAVPVAIRLQYLPLGVNQFTSTFDTNGCASRGPNNILETKLNYFYDHGMHPAIKKWLEDKGYRKDGKFVINDAFIEILSGTTHGGNSLKAPVDALHTYGAIPADLIPLQEGMTWEEYMNPARVTEEHKKLGKEFLKRISIGYEQVRPTSFVQALKDDMLDAAGYAWPVPENGVYPRVEGATFNHAFMLANDNINAFDNYPPFVKLLAKDYKFFDWCYSISITNQNPYPEEVLTLFEVLKKNGLLAFFADAIKRLFSTAPIHEDYPPKPNVQEDIAKAAEEAVGTDLSPQNLAPQELSCAEGLSNLIHAIVVDILPRMISTIELKNSLDDCKKFDRVLKPKRGTIIVSPRIGNTPGHCGIFVNEKDIISNDSKTGTMQKNYTYSSWVEEMFVRRKLHIYFWDFI